MNARLTASLSSLPRPPMNTSVATSRVRFFSSRYRRVDDPVGQDGTVPRTRGPTCLTYPASRGRVNASCMMRRCIRCSSKLISISPRWKNASIRKLQPSCENALALLVSACWVASGPAMTTILVPNAPIHVTGPNRW